MKVGCISLKASCRYIQQHKNRKTDLQTQCVVCILQNHCYLWSLKYYINTNFNNYTEGELPYFSPAQLSAPHPFRKAKWLHYHIKYSQKREADL